MMSVESHSSLTAAAEPSGSSLRSTLSDAISHTKAYLHPFAQSAQYGFSRSENNHGESNRLLSDVAPQLMTNRMLTAVFNSNTALGLAQPSHRRARLFLTPQFSITSPARSLARFGGSLIQSGIGRGSATGLSSHELFILEESDRILSTVTQDLDLSEPRDSSVSLLRGFQATVPSALEARNRRRKVRAISSGFEADGANKLGLKNMADKARGLLVQGQPLSFSSREQRQASRSHNTKRGKDGSKSLALDIPELEKQLDEIGKEKDDIAVKRRLIDQEIAVLDTKIQSLEKIKSSLKDKLLGLREQELELNDEQDGVGELLAVQKHQKATPRNASGMVDANVNVNPTSSKRRKGLLFMPSEHDELPSGVAFMTLTNHSCAITALDLTEPYGTLVSASSDETVRVWDLASGDEVGQLRGHQGMVKCLQVEDNICITGSADHSLRIWDLNKVENFETRLSMSASGQLRSKPRRPTENDDSGDLTSESIRNGFDKPDDEEDPVRDEYDPCLRSLEGHSKEVTSLYFDDNCLVTGASDKTLRQWDLNTGQCVLTMDILWAISNPTSSQALSQSEFGFPAPPSRKASSSSILGSFPSGDVSFSALDNFSGPFSYPTPPYQDGSWEMYQDFVGGVQFWGYALASGSGDGGVRMWDMRTGQAHRTLLGHTAPVTCLQFDETHIISGSLDKSIRIWDLRTGSIWDTIRYDHSVTALQFDTRKILAAAGEIGVKVFNRTTLQNGTLTLNGHTAPAERLRYMDRYGVTGGKDSMIKIWAL